MGFSIDSPYSNPYFNNLSGSGVNTFYSNPLHGIDVNSLNSGVGQDNTALMNLIQQNATGAFALDSFQPQQPSFGQTPNFFMSGDADTSLSSTIQQLDSSQVTLRDGVTKISTTSGLFQLQFDQTGTPDVSGLSTREIKILLNDQYGLREQFADLPEEVKAQLIATAKDKNLKDPTELLLQPLQAAILQSPIYDEVKARVKNMRPKEIYQLAADTTLSIPEKIALQMAGDAKNTVYKNRKKNFDEFIQRMGQEDPGAAEARQKAEELERQVAKNAAGGGSDASSASSESDQQAPYQL